MKTHQNDKFKISQQQEVIVMGKEGIRGGAATQKPLTDIIKEALSEEDQDGVNEFIEFHSCNLCSLTFVNKKLYAQHMKTHESPVAKAAPKVSYAKSGKSQDTMGDLESIFEKMHSETSHVTTSNGSLKDSKNVLITTQESGGITYNITIPQDDIPQEEKNVRVDMPSLNDDDKPAPVSMPSLHDDENTQSSQEQQGEVQQMEGEPIPMDLEELQQAAEGQQLKFIVDENGQFLQLDNHILTTDAEGNQILVQGTDQEQLQHLLQSVGVDGNQVLVQLQDNGEGIDGEGATLQFGEGAQGQMILVQNENGESQLIDASMLQTEGGNLVLQQGADGEATLTTADGIPVSVSFSGEGADGQITVTMASTDGDGQQIYIQQPVEMGEGEGAKQEETAMQLEESSQESTAPTSTEEAPAENPASTTEDEKDSGKDETAVPAQNEEPKEQEASEEKPAAEEEQETKNEEIKDEEVKPEEDNKADEK
jgi:zinc finger protein 423